MTTFEAHIGMIPMTFTRAAGAWANTERITLRAGAVLDLGNGWTIKIPPANPPISLDSEDLR